ncbi:MAG: arylesterase [Rhizobiaceae bacterium]
MPVTLRRIAQFLLAVSIWGAATTIAKAASSEMAAPLEIVGLGDSLMAGYELPEADGFPAVLQAALKSRGLDARVTNAGVSGDTTSGGLERLDWSVPDGTKLVVLELGANDALRGIAPEITRGNLDTMITRLKERNIAVVLAGMLAPPSMGKDYEARFNPVYGELAQKHQVPLIPFFLEGVAGNAALQLPDRIHPNRAGVDLMVENALPVILPAAKTAAGQ